MITGRVKMYSGRDGKMWLFHARPSVGLVRLAPFSRVIICVLCLFASLKSSAGRIKHPR